MTDQHRRLRELLGAYAHEALPQDERAALTEHLAMCPSCRADLAAIRPAVELLRRRRTAERGGDTPPDDLLDRIQQRIAAERALRSDVAPHPPRRRLLAAAAAVLVLAGAAGLGVVVGRGTAPELVAAPPTTASPAPRIPLETVPVVTASGVRTGDAAVVAHTWGVEARFTGTGFVAGERYRAAFRAVDGRLVAAGEFLGTGGRTLTCSMQSSLLRPDAAAFVVTDARGRTVLTARLPA